MNANAEHTWNKVVEKAYYGQNDVNWLRREIVVMAAGRMAGSELEVEKNKYTDEQKLYLNSPFKWPETSDCTETTDTTI